MREYIGRVVSCIGEDFNDHVADLVESTGRFIIRRRVKKFSGRRLARPSGEDLGDVDVLAVDSRERRLLAMETKSFSMAKTPAELSNERQELFGDLQQRRGAVARHLERVQWLKANQEDVLRELGLDAAEAGAWEVVPLLVLDSDLLTPMLTDPPFDIIAAADLMERLSVDPPR